MFYNENIMCDGSLYTDGIIYSPNVPFFRDHNNQLIEPFLLSIISCPAPNLSAMETEPKNITIILTERIIKILKVASFHNHKNIILGAWGCGAFGNDPKLIATIFAGAIKAISSFEHVCFAVYDNKEDQPTYNTFKNIIK